MRLTTIILVVVGGLALALLPLSNAALLVAGSAVAIAALVRPEASLYLLAFAVPFGSLRTVSMGGLSLTAVEVLVALLAACWLARSMALRQVRLAHAPLIIPLLLWILAQLLSLFDAVSLSLAAKELIKWSEILAVYVIASQIMSEGVKGEESERGREGDAESRLRVLALVLLAATLVEALIGVYQFVTGSGPATFLIGRFLRAYGTFDQPNPFAGYLNLTLPLAYALLLAAVQQRGWRSPATLALAGWLAVVGAALLMSLSRGAWLGLALAIVAMTLLYSRRMAALMAGGAVLLAAALILSSANLLPSALTERFTSIGDYFRVFDARNVKVTDANFSVVERMAHWQAAWYMINDRPWLGFGTGNYPAAYSSYNLAGWKESLGHAHNFPLNVWAETGVIGLLAYLTFLAAALWACWRAAQACGARGDVVGRAIALGVLSVLLAKITHEMLDDLWVHGMGVQVAMLLAMVYAVGVARK